MSKKLSGNQKNILNTITWSVAANIVLAIIKWIAGYFGNSYALVADAIESSTDIFASWLILIGLRYAQRPADENHPYGHGRVEPLITFVVVVFMAVSASIIVFQSIYYIKTPHTLPEAYTLYVLGAIILWKETAYRMVMKKAKQTGNSSLKAEAWHHRSDAITSVAAFLGILIALILGEGYEAADDWAAIGAALFILYNCYIIFRPALGEIMDEHTNKDLIDEIRKISLTTNGIKGTEKCFIRKSGMVYHVELHALVDAQLTVKEGHTLSHALQDNLKSQLPVLGYVLIHIEPWEQTT